MTQHESGGLSSAHDIEIFRAWKKALPGYTWSRAEVDRNDGLTLFDDSFGTVCSLHFPNANCGYGGEGPHATVTILQEAAFGDFDTLSPIVFNNMKTSFTNKKLAREEEVFRRSTR
jgi:hypothetical protein